MPNKSLKEAIRSLQDTRQVLATTLTAFEHDNSLANFQGANKILNLPMFKTVKKPTRKIATPSSNSKLQQKAANSNSVEGVTARKSSKSAESVASNPKPTLRKRPDTAKPDSNTSLSKFSTKNQKVQLKKKPSEESLTLLDIKKQIDKANTNVDSKRNLSTPDKKIRDRLKTPTSTRNVSKTPRVTVSASLQYPQEKVLWVQEAIEKLISNGTITTSMSSGIGFQKQIGTLYDIAMDKKYKQLKGAVQDALICNNGGSGCVGVTTTSSSCDHIDDSGDKGANLHRQVSDILLHMLLKTMLVPDVGMTDSMESASASVSRGSLKDSGKRQNDNWLKEMSAFGFGTRFGGQLCQVSEGRLNFVTEPFDGASSEANNSFMKLSDSRRIRFPDETGYFRRYVDVRGFDDQDISIRYAKSKILIEGRQKASKEKNFRMLREIVVLPQGLSPKSINLLRGKNNGRIILEEVKKILDTI